MKWILALLLSLFLILPIKAGVIQVACGSSYAQLRDVLTDKYKERLTHRGTARLVNGGLILVEIWESKDKETFSIIYVYPNHSVCLIIGGQDLNFWGDAWDEPA
jgi:hypothetical protein